MPKLWKPLALCLMVVALGACSSSPKKTDGADGAGGTDGTGTGATTESRGVGDLSNLTSYALDDPNSPLAQRTIYFEFDSSEVRYSDRELISLHAAFLAANPTIKARLEGHADERGSREYNIGLGDRRAQSVLQLMELQGAGAGQLSTVSYGEEKPAVTGHDEMSWSQNRRVEIVYTDY